VAQPNELVPLLQGTELFQGVDAPELWLIARQMTEQVYDADTVVFCEGDPGDRLFVLLTGTMRVYVEREGNTIPYANIQAGEAFGEMALLEDAPRSATVRAEVPSRCLTLSKQDFLLLIQRDPRVALVIMKSLSHRLRRISALLEQHARPQSLSAAERQAL
jgi:CRP-like cAMP-binding protein